MIELHQAEWCPECARVRQRLTELGVDFIARQVPVEREARERVRAASGQVGVPTLVNEAGEAFVGEDEILAFLAALSEEPAGAAAHRAKVEPGGD